MSFMNDPCRDTRFGEPDDPTPAPVPTPDYTQKLNECRSMAEDAKRARQENLEFRMADFDPERIEWLIEQLAATKAALDATKVQIDRIAGALGTGETGENLIAVAYDAHKAELDLARLQMELDASCNAEELRQVRAALAEAQQDKERLDWLEKHDAETFSDEGFGDGDAQWSCTYRTGNRNDSRYVCTSEHDSIRAAIDAARAEREGGRP